ncbi:cupin domain-containing protein [Pseudomonas sp. CAU 1711]|uniref:cupin domain-containing protein n=1 Tax=Pseudomonas sp. CAU 1711 TaxID=3140356 RepID=UPI00326133C2
MLPQVTSLYQSPSSDSTRESFTPLLQSEQLLLEQIVSHGQASPQGFWYDQPRPEWVALLRGSARLQFDDGELALAAGDALLIAAHCRHRVAECSTDAIWLALHFQA